MLCCLLIQDLKGLENEGLELEFRSEGPAKSIDAPADIYLKVSSHYRQKQSAVQTPVKIIKSISCSMLSYVHTAGRGEQG